MSNIRQEKVASLLKREISTFFQRNSSVYFGGAMITVTTGRVAPDLALARVYISIFASNDKEELFRFIQDQAREIRFQLGKELKKQLRVIPELAFFMDDSLDYSDEIDRLLKK